MITHHAFIFTPGEWLGEGEVGFSGSEEALRFNTLWQVSDDGEKGITLRHTVELVGVPEKVVNELVVTGVTAEGFQIALTNEMVDSVQGKGVIEEKKIAWEFRDEPGFEGFEVYQLQDDGSYKVHAEYLSSDQFRTIIDGRIWPRS